MSFKKEMELEERLNAIASKAVREPSEEEFTNPFKSSVSKPMSTSKEQIDIDDLRQLSIEAQLAKISTNAIVDKLGIRPSKIKSDVTKEMILDYQNEMLKPIEVGGIKYKYHPSSLDLDEIIYIAPHVDILSDAEERQARNEMIRIAREIERLKEEQSSIPSVIEKTHNTYNTELSYLAKYGETEKKNVKTINAKYNSTIDYLTGQLQSITDKILEKEKQIEEIQFAINSNDMKKSENQAEEIRISNQNKARLKAYEEDLNLLNRGKLNATRLPNETDEEYRERLRQTGQLTVDEDEMAQSANLYNRDKLRERIMELVRDTGIISNALKFLDHEQVFKINQNWSRIKRDFLKVYGFDNNTVKEQDLIDFFEQEVDPIIDAINKGKAPPPTEYQEPESPDATAKSFSTYAELNKLGRDKLVEYYQYIKNIDPRKDTNKYPRSKEDMLKKLMAEKLVSDREVTGQPIGEPAPLSTIPSLFTSVKSPVLAKRVYSLDELKEMSTPFLEKLIQSQSPVAVSGADEEAVRKAKIIVSSARKAIASTNIDKFYEELDKIEAEDANLVTNSLPDIYPRAITGSGLQPIKHDIPNLIEFGKVKISPRKLYYNNTLAIKHKSGNSLVGLPNVQVSDKFVSIIMNLLKGQKPSLKDFTQLELNEKGVYDSLIYIAGLQKEVDNNFNETKQHLKNRLELIEGQIGAGNNNPALKKELHALLGKMAHTGMIGYGDAKRYYTSVTKRV
jgi:hypothetical protein